MAPAQAQEFVLCTELHPTTGDVCMLESEHAQHSDPSVQQHKATNGVKWPTLHELDPTEGYNSYVTFRV